MTHSCPPLRSSDLLTACDGALLPGICASLQQMLGVRLSPDDFELDKLDSHLLPRLQLENDKGAILGVANTLDGLRGRFSGAARTALNQAATRDASLQKWARQHIAAWDFDDLPDQSEERLLGNEGCRSGWNPRMGVH